MKSRIWLIIALLSALLAPPVLADVDFIVRAKGGRTAADQVCAQVGCKVVRQLDANGNVFLIAAPDGAQKEFFLELLNNTKQVEDAEIVQTATLPEAQPDLTLNQSTVAVLNALSDPTLVSYFGAPVLRGYATQPAAQIVRAAETHTSFNIAGSGIVAIIDSGIDLEHPVLKNWIISGYDFTRDVSAPSELAELNQSSVAVLNQSTVAVLNQSTVAVLNQSTVAVLNDSNFAAFGHGTMVAGIIHLVAPRAKLMPLRVFRPDGTARTSDIVRAIHYAVKNDAKVINMSFSLSQFSPQIMRAINYATRQGVICVASVGNEGKDVLVFPAAYGNVIGIASTTDEDVRASFSNFGESVSLAAPGEGIITTFPGSSYAAGWGTSFSAAFVSGAVALLLEVDGKTNEGQALDALANAKFISEQLGHGRLDLYRAVLARRQALGLQ